MTDPQRTRRLQLASQALPVVSLVVLAAVAVVLASACAPKPPVIKLFTISPDDIQEGGFVVVSGIETLQVVAENAARVDFLIAPTGTGVTPMVLFSDTTPKDGFAYRWFIPENENLLGHVWARAYNRKGDSVESEIIGVYHEAPPPVPPEEECPPSG
jgi:hypothetical protein